jgi:rSAM/selenodomain-associated transferase 2
MRPEDRPAAPVDDARDAAPARGLSIVIPALNEAEGIVGTLAALAPLRARGVEVVLADGGSEDATVSLACHWCDRVVTAPRGRAAQMNAGARAASGRLLLFLHADTELPADADRLIMHSLEGRGHPWGRFDVHIRGASRWLPMVAAGMNLRSRLTGIATGDQAMFCTRQAFDEVGGFPGIALMEDIEMSARLRRLGAPCCLRARVVTSGRRWDRDGAWRTILLMWRLRLAHFLGVAPEALARRYRGEGGR